GGALAAEIVGASPHIAKDVVDLDVGTALNDDAVLEELQASPWADRITALKLYGRNVTDRALEAISRSPHLNNVTELFINSCRIAQQGLDALAEWPGLKSLEMFTLCNSVNDYPLCSGRAFDRLLRSPHWGALKKFSLTGHRLRDEGTVALAESPI